MAVETLTLTVQLPPAASEGIATPRLVEPEVAPVIVAPTQVFDRFGVAATVRFTGNGSVTAIVVAAAEFGFMIVSVNVEVPGATIGFGLNALVMVKGNRIDTFADAGPSRLK
jgi:hypothetical protein